MPRFDSHPTSAGQDSELSARARQDLGYFRFTSQTTGQQTFAWHEAGQTACVAADENPEWVGRAVPSAPLSVWFVGVLGTARPTFSLFILGGEQNSWKLMSAATTSSFCSEQQDRHTDTVLDAAGRCAKK